VFGCEPALRGGVNNCDQFAADLVDGLAERSVEHLRVHVQRRVDVGVTYQLRNDTFYFAFSRKRL